MEIRNSVVQLKTPTIDRLTNMPCLIIDNILGRLPIKDAVRTCILSRPWRYNWLKLSTLVFDDSCGGTSGDVLFDGDQFAKIIYHFLLRHSGSILTFKVETSLDLHFFKSDIDEWLHFVTGNDIKEITLRRHTRGKYEVPSCLYSCKQLTHLFMNDIILPVPNSFKGFQNLVSLKLHNFATTFDYVSGEVLENLICNCLVLERLDLAYFFTMSAPVVIRAPKLKYLYLYGDFGGVILQNCPLLVDITLIDYPTPYVREDRQGQEMSWTLLKDLCLLSNLRSLKISAKILKNLCWTNVSGTLLTPSNQLKGLEINSVCLKSTSEVMASLSLLKMFSNIPELFITVRRDAFVEENVNIVEALDQSNCFMRALRHVKITLKLVHDIPDLEVFWQRELELINFILACSPLLEKMTIECDDRVMGYEIMFIRKLLQLKRSWERVTISFSYIRF